jgi:3-phosphoshikimate 1-carboxyvinyltransferase
MFAALADGRSVVRGFLEGRDCRATLGVMAALGAGVERDGGALVITGTGLEGLREPAGVLDCDNSGTTMRLLTGLLCGRPFLSVVSGTAQLRGRPMARISEPLRRMGAVIHGRGGGALAPLCLIGSAAGRLEGCVHRPAVASAQVKSAILLAGLSARGETVVIEPGPARDHTERLLRAMGAPLEVDGRRCAIRAPAGPLAPFELEVPGDISSAAFLIVGAAIVPGSDVLLPGVGVNPTRTGLLDALEEMGADIERRDERLVGGEPVADLRVRYRPLRGVEHGGERIVRMIDEIPALAVAATQAEGRTRVRDAAELRVKESDRIAVTARLLRALGAELEEADDGFELVGPVKLCGATVSSHGDHRLAMAMSVAGLVAEGRTRVEGTEVIGDSYPGFEGHLTGLGAELS